VSRFRKKPVEVEAVLVADYRDGREVPEWIIRGTSGELYPCKPDIFSQIYERAA
jgi:hypothetical protein